MYGHPGATNAWAAAHARRRSLSISHGMAVGALSAAALAGYAVAFFSWAV